MLLLDSDGEGVTLPVEVVGLRANFHALGANKRGRGISGIDRTESSCPMTS